MLSRAFVINIVETVDGTKNDKKIKEFKIKKNEELLLEWRRSWLGVWEALRKSRTAQKALQWIERKQWKERVLRLSCIFVFI